VEGYTHKISGDECSTTLSVGGKPKRGRQSWLERDSRPGQNESRQNDDPDSITIAGSGEPLKGLVTTDWPKDVDWDTIDIYGSDSSGFTADATTYLGSTRGTQFVDAKALAGATRYYKAVVRDASGNTSAESSEVSASIGYVDTEELHPRFEDAVKLTLSADDTYTGSQDAILWDDQDWGESTMDAGGGAIETNYDGVYRIRTRVEARPDGTDWTVRLWNDTTGSTIAVSAEQSGDQVVQLEETLSVTSGHTLLVLMELTSSGGGETVEVESDTSYFQVEHTLRSS
jgi:hypothetical protein